jgi:hypothetical protein
MTWIFYTLITNLFSLPLYRSHSNLSKAISLLRPKYWLPGTATQDVEFATETTFTERGHRIKDFLLPAI